MFVLSGGVEKSNAISDPDRPRTADCSGDNRSVKSSIQLLSYALVIVGALVMTSAQGQDPLRVLAVPGDLETIAQGKTGPKDKKKSDKEKDKGKKPPELAVDRPLLFPEQRLEYLPRTMARAPEMLGDQPPIRVPVPVVPNLPAAAGGAGQAPIVLPGPRGFKCADNGSPRPTDRIYFGCQYFGDLNGALNRAAGANVGNVSLQREYVGLEKTFLEGIASLEVRLPMNTLNVDGNPALPGNHTALGDVTAVLRYALWRNAELDNYFTLGLAVTAPTGPSAVGGIDVPSFTHSTILQPFIGFLWNRGDFFLQGFSALDIPTDRRDVTLLYNDIALGYFVYRTPDASRFLTAFAPAFEIHVANPLNFRSASSPVTFADEVNLGLVGNFEFFSRASLSAGVVTPVTGPRSFNVEGIVQLRFRY